MGQAFGLRDRVWPTLSARATAAAGATLFILLGGIGAFRSEVRLGLDSFMLGADLGPEAELSRRVARSDASRTLILLIEAKTPDRSVELARALETKIRSNEALMVAIEALWGGALKGL